uniref:Transmembrane protein n=1 Tax=Phaseolus vulgaris TaxID=3885 RepID=V7B0R6_PHAVU|nr:hypothetical protein PHAVU_009G177400g [Phaseolus vulgaris]ESW10056.1 hypothetical protein PHAVU_009G177400g [Phaseolus vulgaris]
MVFLIGSHKDSWQPIMTAKTNTHSYWLNWRAFLCSIWILVSVMLSALLVWKYERLRKPATNESGETQKETSATLYEDETWRPCLKGIHPAWLMSFRVVAFIALLVLLIFSSIVDGGNIFYYYTQWTFTLITIYFGVDHVDGDAEKGIYDSSALPQSSNNPSDQEKSLGASEVIVRQHAGILGYIFQIIFQINAGAVMLTDCVFWFIIVPFLTIKDYNLNFLIVIMHSINAVFLIGDTALNCLRFPWFRIGYFWLWAIIYVIFLWMVHACINLWWPYPFLDLSSSYAPLWYFAGALFHIPCYGIFALLMKLKHHILSTRFPDSYQCAK